MWIQTCLNSRKMCMAKIRCKIDEKALYFGIYNDYDAGEVMTSSTPVNQSTNPSKWHHDIINFCNCGLDENKPIPEGLLRQMIKKTTSKANTRINKWFVFDKIKFDGKDLDTEYSFILYLKEEIDEFITKRDGTIGRNTHLGRLKFHNPAKIRYNQDGYNIYNKGVLQAILEQNHGFAYVVRGFEVDTETKTLNIITSLIGLKGIFLSSVFKKKKGVGKKLLLDEINFEAQDIATDSVVLFSTNSFSGQSSETDFDALRKTQVENGKLGEKYVYDNISNFIHGVINDLYHTSKDFPTSPYDIEYTDDKGYKQYIEVKSTSGSRGVFNMSSGEIKFMKEYQDRYALLLVTEVRSSMPHVKVFNGQQISRLRKEYPSVRFYTN